MTKAKDFLKKFLRNLIFFIVAVLLSSIVTFFLWLSFSNSVTTFLTSFFINTGIDISWITLVVYFSISTSLGIVIFSFLRKI